MSETADGWARFSVRVNVSTGEVCLPLEQDGWSLAMDEGFEALNQCLIPINLREELLTKSKITDGPYLVTLNKESIRIKYAFNSNYKGVDTCKCGHSYNRHFDPYEDHDAVGCKYCQCWLFEPAVDDREVKELIQDDSWIVPVLEKAVLDNCLESIENADLRDLLMYGHKIFDHSPDKKVWHNVLSHEWNMMKELHGVNQTAKMIVDELRMGRPDDE